MSDTTRDRDAPLPDPPGGSLGLRETVAAVLSARLLTTTVDAVTAIVLVRLLARTELAVLSLVFLLYELVRQVAALGLPESVFFFLETEGPSRARSVVVRTIASLACMGVVTAGVLLAIVPLVPTIFASWSDHARQDLATFLPVMALVGLLELPSTATHNILVALGRPRLAGGFNVVSSVVTFASLLVPAFAGLGLHGIRVGFVVQAVFRCALTLAMLARTLPEVREPASPGFLRAQLRFAFPLGLHAGVSRLHRHVDKWIVASLLGEAATAAYAVATTEIPFVTALPYAVGAVFVSRYVGHAARGESDALIALFHKGIEKVSLAVVPIAVFVVVFADEIVRVAFGSSYADVVWPFRLVALVTLQRIAQYGVVLQAYGRTARIVAITAVMLIVNSVLVVPLAHRFGIVGAAVANVVANYVGFAIYLVEIARALDRPVFRVFPIALVARRIASTAAVALGTLVLVRLLPQLTLVPRLAVEAFVFFGTSALVGAAAGALATRDWESFLLLFGVRPAR